MISPFVVGIALAVTGQMDPAAAAGYPALITSAPSTTLTDLSVLEQEPPPAPAPLASPAPLTGPATPPPAPPAAAANGGPAPCPPAPKSTRADWLQPGGCGAWILDSDCCCSKFLKVYYDQFNPSGEPEPESPPAERRALPEAWPSPPFPGHEFQGYPLMGVPVSPHNHDPLMTALQGTWLGNWLNDSKIDIYGWVTASGNISTSQFSNQPASYWIAPNRIELDQLVVRFERQADTVQTDHMDWGFRFSSVYGIDYRYLTAGGWFSQQYQLENLLYGYDPTEVYGELYIPWVEQGLMIRVGRWIACPDIETQFAPDNYMGSHSLLFTYDTYTQTGIMLTFLLNEQWMFQAAIHSGTDMAPWYPGALPTGFFGLRWVSKDNRDSIYTCLNNINTGQFRTFHEYGQLIGHDNENYIVSTWTHKFTDSGSIHTATEAYYMWQFDGYAGGTPSVAPVSTFGGGGLGRFLPGLDPAYGVLNYTEFQVSNKDYISVRNEVWDDKVGERTGFANLYSSHAIGLSHNFNDVFQVRPEVGYYRAYYAPAFDDGTKMGEWIIGFDTTLRF
jgi:hypothetical protein